MPGAAPYPPSLASGPSWLELVAVDEEGGAAPDEEAGKSPAGDFPGEGWPRVESIDYASKLIVLVVLLLALPWLIEKLLTAPGELSGHSAGLAMGPASMGVS